jgi:predicted transcriptional regulator
MLKVLLSIKPVFAEKIFDGTKKFEFRKVLILRPHVSTVIVYASSPVQRVLGEFTIESIVSGPLDYVWEKTSRYSGISHEFFLSYFSGHRVAHAIKIGNVTRYEEPRTLEHYMMKRAQQSFVYVDDEIKNNPIAEREIESPTKVPRT